MDLIETIKQDEAYPIYVYQLGGFAVQVEDISAFTPGQMFSVSFQGEHLGIVYKDYAANIFEAARDGTDGLTSVGSDFSWENAVMVLIEAAARDLAH
jgi:hypothetical protein